MHSPEPTREVPPRSAYPWVVVGLLWMCGFLNYADRQALSAVFPRLSAEFHLTDAHLGTLSSAFMLLYATTSPLTGHAVDRLSRRVLIPAGLAFWSVICAGTGMARSFYQLVFLRAAEGLGESFYFPASMSVLADYHGPETRSRAMSIHQTSVYIGTAGGWALGGGLGAIAGWRAPFLGLGIAGLVYAVFLAVVLIEPRRGGARTTAGKSEELLEGEVGIAGDSAQSPLLDKVAAIFRNRVAAMLLLVFIGANFVAAGFLTWLPSLVGRGFDLGLAGSAVASTVWPLSSVPGAIFGGWLADRAARRLRGGRILVQALGLLLAAPFVLLIAWAPSVLVLEVALLGAGLCKGIYDANIFASVYDVVRVEDRGMAAGLMNTVGWSGGFLAPIALGFASERFGLPSAIASSSVVYLLAAVLALAAARAAERP
ncbi:MAG: MFS transporter [Isosphaeraceae bacterium]